MTQTAHRMESKPDATPHAVCRTQLGMHSERACDASGWLGVSRWLVHAGLA